MIWRPVASAGTSREPPESVFMVGMNVPAETDATGLAEFNEFYTHVHVPEVMQRRGYSRGTRFELYRAFLHPEPGCPRFCAVYEADAAATEATLEGKARWEPAVVGAPDLGTTRDVVAAGLSTDVTGPVAFAPGGEEPQSSQAREASEALIPTGGDCRAQGWRPGRHHHRHHRRHRRRLNPSQLGRGWR